MAFTLSGILSLNNTAFMRSIRESTSASDKFSNKVKGAGSSIKSMVVAGAGFAGVAFGIRGIAETFVEFEKQMSNVQALTGETSKVQMTALAEKAKEMGRILPASASDAAKAMAELGSAGFTTAEIMKSVEGTLYLATAAQTDMATAADISSSTLRGFGMDAGDAGHMADVLAKTAATTNAGIIDLGESLKYSAPVAHSFGLGLEEVAAATGIMANAGIKGSMSGTTLRSAMISLTKVTKPARAAMDSIGFSAFDTAGNMKPLSTIIGDMKSKTKDLTQEQRNNAISTIFGKTALSGMMTLIDAGPEKLDELTASFKDSDGAAKQMADTQTNNLWGAMKLLEGAWETAKINIGEKAAPALTQAFRDLAEALPKIGEKLVELTSSFVEFATKSETSKIFMDGMNKSFSWIKEHHTEIEGAIIGVATAFVTAKTIIVGAKIVAVISDIAFAIASVAGGAATVMEGLAFVFGGIATATVGLVAIIVGLVAFMAYEIYKHWDEIKVKGTEIWEAIKISANDSVAYIQNVWSGLANFFTFSVVNPIKKGWNELNNLWGGKDFTMGGARGYQGYKGIGPVTSNLKAMGNANGTSYFTGGASMVNERGGEMQLLSNGTGIIPADRTKQMVEGEGNKGGNIIEINIDAKGMNVDELVTTLQLRLSNM